MTQYSGVNCNPHHPSPARSAGITLGREFAVSGAFEGVILVVVDSVGIGAMPDAADYGDACPTLADIGPTIADSLGLHLPRGTGFRKEMTQEDGAAWVFHCPVEARAGSCTFGAK